MKFVKKNILKNVFCFLLVLLVIFKGNSVLADEGEYTIEKYKINMNVGEDNVIHIDEFITVNFSESRYGIYRKIPIINDVIRADESTDTIRAQIKDIRCNTEFETERGFAYTTIKLGDESTFCRIYYML